jgi:hypothetical protein
MYIFGKSGILSVVKHRAKPGMVMARSISRDDLAHYFPGAKIIATPRGDYHYRVTLPASDVAKVVARCIEDITYDRVKPSVAEDRRLAYYDVWGVMMGLQDGAPVPRMEF